MKKSYMILILFISLSLIISCQTNTNPDGLINFDDLQEWTKYQDNPVYQDPIPGYEVASDPHVFFDNSGDLWMIYSGDHQGHISIKLAEGTDFTTWQEVKTLLSGEDTPGSGEYAGKETSFYRYSSTRDKHQIYYIAYYTEDYNAQVFMAESDDLQGPYPMTEQPIITLGNLAGYDVKVITSPSIVEHEGALYMVFIGWNNNPDEVTAVWVLGAVSYDDGLTWTDIQEVDTPIAMEGQLTKGPDGYYYAVSTQDYEGEEAIFISRAEHPFGPYNDTHYEPIITKTYPSLEKDEIIAPQITFDHDNRTAYLYYTGADHSIGWWVMLAFTEYSLE